MAVGSRRRPVLGGAFSTLMLRGLGRGGVFAVFRCVVSGKCAGGGLGGSLAGLLVFFDF